MGKFNPDSKIRDVLADEKAKELIEKYFPGAIKHPLIPMAKGMKIKVINNFYKQAGLTKADVDKFQEDLYNIE